MKGGSRANAGRNPKWVAGETVTIRVPKAFAARLMKVAENMDAKLRAERDRMISQMLERIDEDPSQGVES